MDIEGRHLAITGGASQIGRELTAQLLEAGVGRITLIDNFSLSAASGLDEFDDDRISLFRGDILRFEDVIRAFHGVEGVFHIAGFLTQPLGQRPSLGLDVNVRGTANVVECAEHAGVQRVVFSSTNGVYGAKSHWRGTLTEEHPFMRHDYVRPGVLYAASKIIGEGLCETATVERGLSTVSLRYSTVYGRRQHARGVNSRYLRAAAEEARDEGVVTVPPEGDELHDYVFVGDVASANIAAMRSEVAGRALNVASGQVRSVEDLVRIAAEHLGVPCRGGHGERSTGHRDDAPFRIDLSASADQIGWRPTTMLEEGLRLCLEWDGLLPAEAGTTNVAAAN